MGTVEGPECQARPPELPGGGAGTAAVGGAMMGFELHFRKSNVEAEPQETDTGTGRLWCQFL